MTKLCRSMTICCLFFGVLLLASTSRAQTRPPIVEQLAKTYGLQYVGYYLTASAVFTLFGLLLIRETKDNDLTVSAN